MSAVPEIVVESIRRFARSNNLLATEPVGNETHQIFDIVTPAWYRYIVERSFRVSRVPSDESTNLDEGIEEVIIRKQLDGQDQPLAQALLHLSFNDATREGNIRSGIPKEERSETDSQLLLCLSTALKNHFTRNFSNI